MSKYDKTVVKFSTKLVINLGGYESVHIDVGLEDQPREGENVAQAYERIRSFVEKRVIESAEQYDSAK